MDSKEKREIVQQYLQQSCHRLNHDQTHLNVIEAAAGHVLSMTVPVDNKNDKIHFNNEFICCTIIEMALRQQ